MMKHIIKLTLCLLFVSLYINVAAENGYRLWLRYDKVADAVLLKKYQSAISSVLIGGNSETIEAIRKELKMGLSGLLCKELPELKNNPDNGTIIIGTPVSLKVLASLKLENQLQQLGNDGYLIKDVVVNGKKCIVISANTDIGVMYGMFHFLRLLQTQQDIAKINIMEAPKINNRVLNHWDNLDRTVERGYAGFSLWDWHRLPDYVDPRYVDYARANASVGINGTVLTNVNANALVLTETYLKKVQALANAFRPYGIKVYLTARFSAPIEIGKLKTADPLNEEVQAWWKNKVEEIYRYIPDFGGFLVKANSEGQPGPQNYGRNHADGANMLADALSPFSGIVMWRAFVYDNNVPEDRAKQAYNEFKPLDGQFRPNVLIQVKNGPIDFQPREPFHPLFGAMPKTPLMMEFQITQEYLGFATHLVYLGPLFKECLDADTYASGKGTTVAKIIDGSADNHKLSGMAGVANIGNDINWCGHPFAQSNWYVFGRLAWDPYMNDAEISNEWLRMTFSNNRQFLLSAGKMMAESHEITVNYMTPVGLHHIMGWDHHFGPGPWIKDKPRADWTSVYYHKADTLGIGFNRTQTGSNALGQYAPEVEKLFGNIETCPEEFLLWFHRVGWDYRMKSGKTLWEELCYRYYAGVESVKAMQVEWDKLESFIDSTRFNQVKMLLAIQAQEATIWRNSCVLYFQQFSRRPIPQGLEVPEKPLQYYENLKYHFVPGI